MELFQQILNNRNLDDSNLDDFISPNYDKLHDPFLLPDMKKAIKRLVLANKKNQKITIYGDYDIDGLTASTLLLDAFTSLGFKQVKVFIPNRFVEGYGLTVDAIEKIIENGADLIVTVDCGSLSYEPIARAKELGVDVIVTDHHSVNEKLPDAVAVINPKRKDHTYPFIDLAGVGVAFKLIQALKTKLPGLENGQEKWLLDLVALGSVCDVVSLTDENRIFVYWGLKVLQRTRRKGLLALIEVSSVNIETIKARDLGFGLGPRMNASGRLETALYSLDLLRANDQKSARSYALMLNEYNKTRRSQQDTIHTQAINKISNMQDSPVLVVCDKNWSHGIVGIVAAKLVERYKKPAFVLQEVGDTVKGSARSYGDFSLVDAIKYASDTVIKGGGHKMAAGVTIHRNDVDKFRQQVNNYYSSLNLKNQDVYLMPKVDASILCLGDINIDLYEKVESLEPFGNGNQEPVIHVKSVLIQKMNFMGSEKQHIKLTVLDDDGHSLNLVKFNNLGDTKLEIGENIAVWFHLISNTWNNRTTIEGKILHLSKAN